MIPSQGRCAPISIFFEAWSQRLIQFLDVMACDGSLDISQCFLRTENITLEKAMTVRCTDGPIYTLRINSLVEHSGLIWSEIKKFKLQDLTFWTQSFKS